jgi:hypothetical protein
MRGRSLRRSSGYRELYPHESGKQKIDLLVTATGFKTTYIPACGFMGRNGGKLEVKWREKPEAYFSMCAGGIPKYFFLLWRAECADWAWECAGHVGVECGLNAGLGGKDFEGGYQVCPYPLPALVAVSF